MSMKTVKIPGWFHEWIEAEKQPGETYWEALVRMTGGPSPELVAGSIPDEMADEMEQVIESRREADLESQKKILERFENDE